MKPCVAVAHKHRPFLHGPIILATLHMCFAAAIPTLGDGRQTPDICFSDQHSCLYTSTHQQGLPPMRPTTLTEILGATNRQPLSVREKRSLVSSARSLFSELNPHRFLQLNVLNVDMVQEFDSLSAMLDDPDVAAETNVEFHERMRLVFQLANDRHTTYVRPEPLRSSFATLGFRVKEFFNDGDFDEDDRPRRRYVVAEFSSSFQLPNDTLVVGSELISYDGVDVAEAVQAFGEGSYGSNSAAQFSNGVRLISSRVLALDEIPLATEVKIEFRNTDGSIGTLNVPWVFVEVINLEVQNLMMRTVVPAYKSETTSSPTEGEQTLHLPAYASRSGDGRRQVLPVNPMFAPMMEASAVETRAGPVGHLVVATFNLNVTDALIGELTRVLSLMPPTGLVIDLRDNAGGQADYARALSEMVTDKPVEDILPLTVRASDLAVRLYTAENALLGKAEAQFLLGTGPAAINANSVGESFSGPVEIGYVNPSAPRQPQVYRGPVITLVDGLSYSASDIYTRLQKDLGLSLIVGTSDNVGAGGASSVPYSLLVRAAPDVFEPLPGNVEIFTSFARYYRTAANSGKIVEFFGIEPDIRYYPTFNDGVDRDSDLFEFLGAQLASIRS